MQNKINITDIRKKLKPVKITSFKFEPELYDTFKENLKNLNLKISNVFSEFMKRVNEVIKMGGGEVVFGIEGKNWQRKKGGLKI